MKKDILIIILFIVSIQGADLSRNIAGVVSDASTSLQWEDNSTNVQKNWINAISYCENIILDRKSDWRLPNINELLGLADYSKINPAIKENIFQNITSNDYWSSTSYSTDNSFAFYIHLSLSSWMRKSKIDSLYVLCVRG